MTWGKCRGVFSDNACEGKNGLLELYYADCPETNLLSWGGLNCERVFNGIMRDRALMDHFSPREDPCHITQEGPRQVTLHWPSEGSQWGVESKMTFTGTEDGYLDLAFSMVLTRDVWSYAEFDPPFVGLLFASYLGVNRARAMYFYGENDGSIGWIENSADRKQDFPNFRATGASPVTIPPGNPGLVCSASSDGRKYILPFYYGLLDGDGNKTTTDDTMMFLLMFDRCDGIQFGYAAFNLGDKGPALDWEFIVSRPQVNTAYGFNARLCIKPFVSPEDALDEYDAWVHSSGK